MNPSDGQFDGVAEPDGRVPGSYRDLSNHVFRHAGRVLRAMDDCSFAAIDSLIRRGLLGRWIDAGLIVPTWVVDDDPLTDQWRGEHPGFAHFLEHQPIHPITYPYEWTVSMLADAGRLTLELQRRLLDEGFALKDASAYNVQFAGGRPCWIDLGSIEHPRRRDLWFALDQFSRMFTFPLLLARYAGIEPKAYFLADPQGCDVVRAARRLGAVGRWRPAAFWDVGLPALLERWARHRRAESRTLGTAHADDPTPQRFTLRRLERRLARLAEGYRPRSRWAGYAAECPYPAAAEAAKRRIVHDFIAESRPGVVLDLGCNTGEYSLEAAEAGASAVVALDADHDAVERLYRRNRTAKAPITPIVADLLNPSPALGWMNREREALLARLRADCVLGLALTHHLCIEGNLDPTGPVELLASLARRDVLIELVPPDDPMVRRRMRFRADSDLVKPLDAWRAALAERFELLAEHPLPDSGRRLVVARRRR